MTVLHTHSLRRQSATVFLLPTSLVAYVAAIVSISEQVIAPRYSYLGFTYREPHSPHLVAVVGIIVVLSLMMPTRLDRPSAVVLWIHFMIATIPSMVVPLFTPIVTKGEAFQFALVVGIAWLFLCLLTSSHIAPSFSRLSGARRMAQHVTDRVGRRFVPAQVSDRWQRTSLAILLGFSVAISGLLLLTFGFSLQFHSLTDVGEVRLEYRLNLTAAPPGTIYLILIASNVVNPLLFIRGLRLKRLESIAAAVGGQLLIYSIAGYKMTLLSLPALLGIFLWLRHRRTTADARGFLAAVTLIVLSAWGLFKLTGNMTLILIFVMRFVVAPGNLAAAYVGVFENRPQLFWSQSFLSSFVDYPYAATPNFLVGSVYRGDSAISANVNSFGDGFISMRVAGILIEMLVLALVLWVLDAALAGAPLAESAALVLLPAFALSNSNVFTSVTSHGFGIAIVVGMLGLAGLSQETSGAESRTGVNPVHRADVKSGSA